MPERVKSITEVSRSLTALSQSARTQMKRYVITDQGEPQSVLLGYKDYQGLKMAAELLHRPDVVESIKSGLDDLKNGNRISGDEMKQPSRMFLKQPI
jgi:PHD/YefM family antitoxin component YafN of YafNO toxin-antitoxin module